jgi:hypothetical protein
MHVTRIVAAAALSALTVGAGAALAGRMHPVLGARLTGMGEHGVVNLRSQMAKRRLCWNFHVMSKGVTHASIRDRHGMIVARLGKRWRAKGCAAVPAKALRLIEAHPGRYVVWVDTKGHPGDLRGKLFAGMAHM